MIRNNLYIKKLFLKFLIVKINDIDRYKLIKYSFISKSINGHLFNYFFEMDNFGPNSREVYEIVNELEHFGYLNTEKTGKITQIDSYRFFNDIEETHLNMPLIIKEFEKTIFFLKQIEPFIENFSDKELFTTILFFIREEGIYNLKKLYEAVKLYKGDKFKPKEFLAKCFLLKFFCFVDIHHGEVSLIDNPLEEWNTIKGNRNYLLEDPLKRNRLLKSSYGIIKFFERNAEKMRNADPEFLIRNSESFLTLLKKFKKMFSSTVGNGLN